MVNDNMCRAAPPPPSPCAHSLGGTPWLLCRRLPIVPIAESSKTAVRDAMDTVGLLNADRIAKLPDGAVVINTARGVVVDDDALIEALQSGKLAAAGLDVFNNEPNIDTRIANRCDDDGVWVAGHSRTDVDDRNFRERQRGPDFESHATRPYPKGRS